MSKDNTQNLISFDEVINLAKLKGVNFGKGDPYNRLRYYIKIGLLPNASRKSFNGLPPAGALPINTVDKLVEIDNDIKSGKSIQTVIREVTGQNINLSSIETEPITVDVLGSIPSTGSAFPPQTQENEPELTDINTTANINSSVEEPTIAALDKTTTNVSALDRFNYFRGTKTPTAKFLIASGVVGMIALVFTIGIVSWLKYQNTSNDNKKHIAEVDKNNLPSLQIPGSALGTTTEEGFLAINVPTNLKAKLTAGGGITTENTDVDAGTGKLTASNVIYSITAGQNVSITGGQNAVISATAGSVDGTANRITVSGSQVDIASNYSGQNSITTVGTITSGTWQATALTDAYVSDTLTINASGSVDWTALTNYPSDCGVGFYVQAINDTLTCALDTTGGTPTFATIATGINSTAIMTVNTGASIVLTGTGIVEASKFKGSGSTSDAVDLASEVSGTLPAASVGTGLTNAQVNDDLTLTNITQITSRLISDTTGTLAVGRGGTGAATFTSNGVLYGNGAGAIQATIAGTTNQCFVGNTGLAPGWGPCGGGASNSFETISTPSGTSPVADSSTDTLSLTVTGANLTITGTALTDTIDFNISESTLAGNGLGVSGDGLVVNVSTGLEINTDNVRIDQTFSPTWTGQHTFSPSGTNNTIFNADDNSNLQIASTISADSTLNPVSITITDNAAASTGTIYGLNLTNADNGINTGTIDALARLNNANAAETTSNGLFIEQTGAGTLTNAIQIKQTAGTITNLLGYDNGTNNGLLKIATLTGNQTYTLPDASGTFANSGNLGNSLEFGAVANKFNVKLDTITASTFTTSSRSGMEITSNGLSLLLGCTSGGNELLKWNGTNWACAADNGTGAASNLQGAYAGGNTITTTTARNIDFTLAASLGTPTSFKLTNNGTADAFVLTNNETVTNGILVNQNTVAKTLTNAINVNQTSGSITNGLSFTGIFTTLINATNFSVSNAGVISVTGGQTADITTLTAGNALTIKPVNTAAANGTGGTLALTGADSTSTTCGTSCTGGAINLLAGSATGASGVTRNGGSVSIDAGTGATANGNINIGTTNALGTTIGRTGGGALSLIGGTSGTFSTGSGNITLQPSGTGVTGNVVIGETNANPDLLVVGIKNTVGNPTAVEGAVYYNSNTGKFNIAEGGTPVWKTLCNQTDQACGSGSGSALSALTLATTGNTIASGDNAQVWNWALTTAAKTAFTFGESAASTLGTGNQYILSVATAAASTAAPFNVIAQGNKIIDTTSTGGITIGSVTTPGALTLHGATTLDNTFSQTGANTFGTGTGAVSLNGDTTVAAGKNLSLASGTGIFTQTFTGTTTTAATFTAGSLTTGNALDLSSSSTLATSSDLIQGDHTATYTTAQTVSGNIADLSRSLTINDAGAPVVTLTVNSPVVSISDNCSIGAGNDVCTNTANVLSIAQNYASASGAVLSITNSGTGASILLPATNGTSSGLQFGTDANAVNLYRSANDTLRTDDAFTVNGNLTIASTGSVTVADETFYGLGSTASDGRLVFDATPAVDTITLTNAELVLAASTAISGGGLPVGCDATTGKLHYNSTSKLFECQADGGSAGNVKLNNILAADASDTNNDSLNNVISWDWSTLTTQRAFTFNSTATGLTTGGVLAIGNSGASPTTYNHGLADTGSLVTLDFKDVTSAAVASTTNGLLVSPVITIALGAATKTINGISVNPTLTTCTTATACNVNGLNIAAVTDSGNFNGTAIKIGTGWDNQISATGFTVSGIGATAINTGAVGVVPLIITTTANAQAINISTSSTTSAPIFISSTSLTNAHAFSADLSTTLRTGGLLKNTAGGSYNHNATTQTGSLVDLSFIDATTADFAATTTTNGINIASTVDVVGGVSSSGTKTINGISVAAPTLTACSGGSNTCVWNGLQLPTVSPTSTIAVTSLNIPNSSAVAPASSTLIGINVGNITGGGAGTETAINIGTGWDNVLSVNGTPVITSTGKVPLSSLGAGTAINSIDSTNFAQTWNWSSLTSQRGLTLDSDSLSLTTGGVLAIGSANTAYNHSGSETGSLATLTLTDISTNGGITAATTNGLTINTTFNTGNTAGAKIIRGVRVSSPTITNCFSTSFACNFDAFATSTAAYTQSTSNVFNFAGFNVLSAGALLQNTAAGTINWKGADITLPTITANFAGSTVTAAGLNVNVPINAVTLTAGTAATMYGLNISAASFGTISNATSSGTLTGVNIAEITAGGATETAINIGTGWDTSILGGSALSINTASAGTLYLGNNSAGNDNNAKTINIGIGTGADTINIGTGGTTGDTFNIGTGIYSSGSSVFNLFTAASTASQNVNIATGALTTTINTIIIGQSTNANTSLVLRGTGASSAITFANFTVATTGATSINTGASVINPLLLTHTANTNSISIVANSVTSTGVINISANGLTTGSAIAFGTPTALTTGGFLNASGNNTYNHTGAQTGSLVDLKINEATSLDSAATTTTNVVNIVSNFNVTATTGGGTKTINGINVASPTFSFCTGSSNTCVWNGLQLPTVSTAAGVGVITNVTSLNIPTSTATAAASTTLTGINVGNITGGGAGTETAINIGTGWDTILSGTTAGSNIFSFTSSSLTSAGALTVTSCTGCSAGATTLQTAYTASSSPATITLDSTRDGIIIANPAGSGTDSGQVLSLTQANVGAVNVLSLSQLGTGKSISLAKEQNHTIGVEDTTVGTAGGSLTLKSGAGLTTGAGGAIAVTAGAGGATGAGGAINLTSGAGGVTSGASGAITIATGATTSGNTGAINLTTGTAPSFGGGGAINITTGGGGLVSGGNISLTTGSSGSGSNGASISLTASAGGGSLGGAGSPGGAIQLVAGAGSGGAALSGGGAGANISLTTGAGGAGGTSGNGAAGGNLAVTFGAGGTSGTGTGGTGGGIAWTLGNGGSTTGAGTGGAGGGITLTTGAGGTTVGGTNGTGGSITLITAVGGGIKITPPTSTAPTVDLVSILNTAASQPTITTGVDALQIDFAIGAGASIDNAALRINVTSAAATGTNTLAGINIANLTSPNANVTETAINIGTGWDTILSGTLSATSSNGVSITTGNLPSVVTQNALLTTLLTADTGGTVNGLNIIPPATTHGITNGILIGNVSSSLGVDTAINIGTGWDAAIQMAGTNTIGATGATTFSSTQTSGTVLNISPVTAGSVTLTSALTGLGVDVSTGYTSFPGRTIIGQTIDLPDGFINNGVSGIIRGLSIANAGNGAITQQTSGTTTYSSINITNPDIVQTAGTITANGAAITLGTITIAGTQNGILITPPATTNAGGTTNGINIGGITTASNGTDTAINIGTGWDTGLSIIGTTLQALSVSGISYTNAGTTVKAVGSIAYSDTSTNAAGTETVIGLEIDPTINTSASAGTKNNYGININPTFTACGTTGGSCGFAAFRVQTLPAITQSTTNTYTVKGFELAGAGALLQQTAAGTINWRGTDIALPTINSNIASGIVTADGVRITIPASAAVTQAASATATMNGINIIAPTTSGPASGTLNGLNIANLTSPGGGTETAINIGTGWDTSLYGSVTGGVAGTSKGLYLQNATNSVYNGDYINIDQATTQVNAAVQISANGATLTDNTLEANSSNTGSTTAFNLLATGAQGAAGNDGTYFEATSTFSALNFDIQTAGIATATLQVEFCSANTDITTVCDTWAAVSGLSDGTTNYTTDGKISWTDPAGSWITSKEATSLAATSPGAGKQGKWLRIRTSGSPTVAPTALYATISISTGKLINLTTNGATTGSAFVVDGNGAIISTTTGDGINSALIGATIKTTNIYAGAGGSSSARGIDVTALYEANTASAHTNAAIGGFFKAQVHNLNASGNDSVAGIFIQNSSLTGSASTFNSQIGVNILSPTFAGTIATNSTGINIGSQANASSTTTYGINVASQAGGTNVYGINIGNQTGATNAYGLYLGGADSANLYTLASKSFSSTTKQVQLYNDSYGYTGNYIDLEQGFNKNTSVQQNIAGAWTNNTAEAATGGGIPFNLLQVGAQGANDGTYWASASNFTQIHFKLATAAGPTLVVEFCSAASGGSGAACTGWTAVSGLVDGTNNYGDGGGGDGTISWTDPGGAWLSSTNGSPAVLGKWLRIRSSTTLSVLTPTAYAANMSFSSGSAIKIATSGTGNFVVDNSGAVTINTAGTGNTAPLKITSGAITTGTVNILDIIGVTASGGTENAINIGNITAGAGTENAIKIGTGWDTAISIAADTAIQNPIVVSTKQSGGTIASISYPAGPWTQGATLTGLLLDLSTNVTNSNQAQTGIDLRVKDGGTSGTVKGIALSGTYDTGLEIAGLTAAASGTLNGISLGNFVGGGAIVNAINIGTFSSPSAAAETAINIGSGWDASILFGGTSVSNTELGTIKFARQSSTDLNTCGTAAAQGLVFRDDAGTQQGHFCVDNSTGLEAFGRSWSASSTDLAENYSDIQNSLEPGDLVTIDTVTGVVKAILKTTTSYDPNILGVVSTDPGLLLSDISENSGATNLVHPKPVALAGRVPVKVSTENGPISAGDPLTSSSNPGLAMKQTQPGPTIGKALESYSDTTQNGKILVFVQGGYWAPPLNAGTPLTLTGMENITTVDLVAVNLTTDNLIVNNTIAVGDKITLDKNGKLTVNGEVVVAGKITLTGDILISGKVDADIVAANEFKVKSVVDNPAATAGTATLLTGTKELIINTTKVADTSLVFITPTTQADQQLAVIEKIAATSFKVTVPNNAAADITFNWIIVNQQISQGN